MGRRVRGVLSERTRGRFGVRDVRRVWNVGFRGVAMFNLESAALFVDVVKSGSISQAAERLYLSKSMIKKRIDALEADLGMPLLERTTKGVMPTAAGVVLMEQTQKMLAMVDELREQCARADERQERRVVRVAYYSDFVFPMIQYCCDAFAERHPEIAVVPVFTKFAKARTGLRNGLFDVALCPKADAPDMIGLTTVPLYMNLMRGMVSYSSDLAKEPVLTREHLARSTVVMHALWCAKSDLDEWRRRRDPWVDVALSTEGAFAIQSVCNQGGVYLYPESDASQLPYVSLPLEDSLESWATLTYAMDPAPGVLEFAHHAVDFFGALVDDASCHLLASWSNRPV